MYLLLPFSVPVFERLRDFSRHARISVTSNLAVAGERFHHRIFKESPELGPIRDDDTEEQVQT